MTRMYAPQRPQASEYGALPLRAHGFLAGVPLHDVWEIDLPRLREGITLDRFFRATDEAPFTPSPLVRSLLGVRLLVGRMFGLDREPASAPSDSFVSRLTAGDRAKCLIEPGTPDGMFRVVYRFENEELLEIINRTAHAAAVTALVERADGYRYYFAVYVRQVSWLTPVYLTAIDPFRKLIVYPSLMRSVRVNWDRACLSADDGGRPTPP